MSQKSLPSFEDWVKTHFANHYPGFTPEDYLQIDDPQPVDPDTRRSARLTLPADTVSAFQLGYRTAFCIGVEQGIKFAETLPKSDLACKRRAAQWGTLQFPVPLSPVTKPTKY